MLLATDLDGTFLGGKSLHKQQLYRIIRKNPGIRLVFVTGRGLESVIPLLNDPIIPNPDFIICDVGATIVNGHTLDAVDAIQGEIEKKWPGAINIQKHFDGVDWLRYQEVPQQRRCSFFLKDTSLLPQAKELADDINCDILYSAGKFLDILPKGVNKGSSLIKLIDHLQIDKDDVLVAGDTLNDLAMYECGFKGVTVGLSEQALLNATQDMKNVYHAETPGAGGIIEAMKHFDAFKTFIPEEKELNFKTGNADEEPQLIMMYHRFPYELKNVGGEIHRVPPKSPNGILPTLQSFFDKGRSGVWIAWEETPKSGEVLRNVYIDKERYPNLMASRIGLTKKEVDIFYKVFSKEAFWPTIFAFTDKAKFNHAHWDHFVKTNRLFAEKAAQQADYEAIVWIHDYNLWMVPGILRELRPDLRIGFFHHTAFPAANTFNILPWRREIIGSLLQCDYIGFHIPRYVENFVDVVKSLMPAKINNKVNCAPRFLTYSTALGVEQMTTELQLGNRSVYLGANPVGVNVDYIKSLMEKDKIRSKINALKKQTDGKQVILSVERLDYVKGPLEKVLAFEEFLKDYPEFHGKVELVNICTPPAQGMKVYEKIQHELEQAIGRINGRYAQLNWTPIHFFFRALPFEEVVTYYALADVAWITPLRDGLNLVAKEYIAAQGELDNSNGILILSEFAGAAVELQYALLTNPYDYRSLKDALLQALIMNPSERKMRMQRLYEHVTHYDIDFWADDFIGNLLQATPKEETQVVAMAS